MSRATMDSARVAGALAGADAVHRARASAATYVFVTSSTWPSLALTFGVRAAARRGPERDRAVARRRRRAPGPSGWRELMDGLRTCGPRPRLLATMWLAFLINLTAYPASGGLLPYVARSIYHVDATGLGWLVASFSFGASSARSAWWSPADRAIPSAPCWSTPRSGTRCCSASAM